MSLRQKRYNRTIDGALDNQQPAIDQRLLTKVYEHLLAEGTSFEFYDLGCF